jgi:hypothetical protein
MRGAGSARWDVRNSASSRVKISLVTAARLYFSRRARQRANMRAVLPEPTGLGEVSGYVIIEVWTRGESLKGAEDWEFRIQERLLT